MAGSISKVVGTLRVVVAREDISRVVLLLCFTVMAEELAWPGFVI